MMAVPAHDNAHDRLLTVDQVAERLNVGPRFVRWLIHERRIDARHIGRYVRIRESVVEAFIEAGAVPAAPARTRPRRVALWPAAVAFGRIRRLPSGRWQARYPGPDGIDRPAPDTFATKTDAATWLTMKEAEIRSGDWIDPDAGSVAFADYATSWVAERPGLRPKTVQLYEGLVRLHLVPVLTSLGVVTVADIKPGTVRRWRKKLLDSGAGANTVAKAYRLLKAIMSTAVDDELIKSNPCRIEGAGQEHAPERPVLTVPQVFALADAFTDRRYRLLVHLAVFCSLRWGELAALTRDAIDLEHGIVRFA